MKRTTRVSIVVAGAFLFVLAVVVLIATAPKHPVALIRVVDTAGKPIPGVVVLPEGFRTKPGPYEGGWYSWRPEVHGLSNSPATTDRDGYARVPYPKYVFERIETGKLCLAVNHPDYVPDRPECRVAIAPPAGAPWRAWADYVWYRIQHKALVARTEPLVLQKGAILKISVRPGAAMSRDARLFAQVSGPWSEDTNFWSRPVPGVIMTRRLAAGPHTVRVGQLDANGSAWFSDVIAITAVMGQTSELVTELKRGATVRGQLDAAVPRPVKRGRVVAHVWPQGCKPEEGPPQWHAWGSVHEDGSFVIDSLPEGDLEIVALCDGFVSTNGPGQSQMRYPQKHLLGTNDLALTIGMEPTARLEVSVSDEEGHPCKGVRVLTWPNVRYGEWSATILVGDLYKTSDWLLSQRRPTLLDIQKVPDFEGVSDSAGVAVLPNVPANETMLAIDDPQYALPAVETSVGRKEREARFALVPGQTNHISIRVEPREKAPIRHY